MNIDSSTPSRTRRLLLPVVAVVAVLIVLALLADPVARAVTGRSLGSHLAEHDGHIRHDAYARAVDAPLTLLPDWLPLSTRDVSVVRPGPAEGGVAGEVRFDAVVAAGTRAPASCVRSTSWSMPFDGGGDWPSFETPDLLTCDGWTLAMRGRHWYVWGVPTPSASPRPTDEAAA